MIPPLSPQNEVVLAHLRAGRPLTQAVAARLMGIWRLGARIWELREAGWPVETKMVGTGQKWYAEYRLVLRGEQQFMCAHRPIMAAAKKAAKKALDTAVFPP